MTDQPDTHSDSVYVRRDDQGDVVSISREPAPDHGERCAATDPDVAAFMHAIVPGNASLAASDLALIRVIEDLVDVLIQKEVLRLTDLPERAQAKLLSRQHLRSSLRSLTLFGDDDDETL
ncbi:MAG: hypothetical protein WC809_21940 [Sinimarinibacterium sp.]